MKNRRENPQKFVPTVGHVYENAGGGRYRCQSVWEYYDSKTFAWMQNVASGWTCRVHGIVRYEDGTIEWDYSVHGHFEKLPEQKPEEIRQRQGSLMNAMLCSLI